MFRIIHAYTQKNNLIDWRPANKYSFGSNEDSDDARNYLFEVIKVYI